jgi:thymidylate kinase
VSRRFDEDAADVRARNTEVFELDWRDTNAVVVDAAQSPEAVLSAIRAAVWKRL